MKEQILKKARSVLVSVDSRLAGLQTARIHDVTDSDFHPYQQQVRSLPYGLFNAPLELGRGLDFFPFTGLVHPFVRALATQGNKPQKSDIIRRLNEYYKLVSGLNAAEWLDISKSNDPLYNWIAWARVFPWQNQTPEGRYKSIVNNALTDSAKGGESLDISHGWKSLGPISNDLLDIEAERLLSVWKSLQSRGFIVQRPGLNTRVTVLATAGKGWVWTITNGGQHRVAAASALSIPNIPIFIERIVRREDVSHWPRVRSGQISEDDALRVFDLIFDGRLPSALRTWSDFVENRNLSEVK